jgi:photosystem II stability/assembly factor-like uncharacterized protein
MQNKIVVIGLVLSALAGFLQAGWVQQHFGTNLLYDIDFPVNDVNNGFACGANSSLWKTIDGGAEWRAVTNLEPSGNFNAINMPADPLNVYIACDSGNVQISTDGGDNWQKATVARENLNGLNFISPNQGYVVGDAGIIFKTNDGGMNWEPVSPPTTLNLYNIFALDDQRLFVVGDSGSIFHSTDGGSHWELISSTVSTRLYGLYFRDENGWAVGASKTYLLSTDGGQSWVANTLPVPSNTDFYSVCFPQDNQIGYVCGTFGKIAKTTDGGISWNVTNLLYHLNRIEFPQDAMIGWVCGQNEAIYKTTNGGEPAIAETNLNQTESEAAFSCTPNPFRNNIVIRIPCSVNRQSMVNIYNTAGKLIRSFALLANNGQRSAVSEFVWDGTNELNQRVAPGIYLLEYRNNTNKFEHLKLTLLE